LSLVAKGILEGLGELCVSDIRMTLYQGSLTTTTATIILTNTMSEVAVMYRPEILRDQLADLVMRGEAFGSVGYVAALEAGQTPDNAIGAVVVFRFGGSEVVRNGASALNLLRGTGYQGTAVDAGTVVDDGPGFIDLDNRLNIPGVLGNGQTVYRFNDVCPTINNDLRAAATVAQSTT
jgi:hypothetical protein